MRQSHGTPELLSVSEATVDVAVPANKDTVCDVNAATTVEQDLRYGIAGKVWDTAYFTALYLFSTPFGD